MSHSDGCEYVEKDFVGQLPRGEFDSEAEFRITVDRDVIEYKSGETVTWYNGQITLGNRWSDYTTVHAPSGRDSKDSVLESFKLLRDSLNEAIEFLEQL